MVKVIVGDSKTEYYAHRNVLIAKSEYFAISLKECWNGKENEIELTDHTEVAFDAFLTWLYKGSIPSTVNPVTGSGLNLYRLGHFLMSAEFQNAFIDILLDHMSQLGFCFHPVALEKIRDWDLYESKLYELCLRNCAHTVLNRPDKIEAWRQEAGWNDVEDLGVWREIVESMNDCYIERDWREVWNQPTCTYHEHPDGEKCARS